MGSSRATSLTSRPSELVAHLPVGGPEQQHPVGQAALGLVDRHGGPGVGPCRQVGAHRLPAVQPPLATTAAITAAATGQRATAGQPPSARRTGSSDGAEEGRCDQRERVEQQAGAGPRRDRVAGAGQPLRHGAEGEAGCREGRGQADERDHGEDVRAARATAAAQQADQAGEDQWGREEHGVRAGPSRVGERDLPRERALTAPQGQTRAGQQPVGEASSSASHGPIRAGGTTSRARPRSRAPRPGPRTTSTMAAAAGRPASRGRRRPGRRRRGLSPRWR